MNYIYVKGAKEHNLKNIDVKIPKNKLVVIAGLSGSGKSTLAMDTIYAEGQRRYLESVSSYARQFLGELKRPNVEQIIGLSPAIAIEQKSVSHNPRSTVGTVTEIYDYMRVLFARIGKAYCPKCKIPVEKSSIDEIIERVYDQFDENSRLYVFAPIAKEKKGEFKKELETMRKNGYKRVEIDGEIYDLDEITSLKKSYRHTINLLIDRLKLKKENFERLYEAIELALKESDGFVEIRELDKEGNVLKKKTYSEKLVCPECGFSFPEITPKLFSFNSPYGACEECHGLGFKFEFEPTYILDYEKNIYNGGVSFGKDTYMMKVIENVIKHFNDDPQKKIKDLKKETIDGILYGTTEPIRFEYKTSNGVYRYYKEFEGLINMYERRYRNAENDEIRLYYQKEYMVMKTCNTCHGKRLKEEPLNVKINGKNIQEITEMPIEKAKEFFETISLTKKEKEIVGELLTEIKKRIGFLVDVGLGYITLSRSANTLSGGESQRVRLATQIGSGLTGVTYVLDEPTIGLHPRDNDRLIETLKKLKELGNTVIIVEHDEEVIKSSDYIVDLGPGAGINGGEVVYSGTVKNLLKNPGKSLTGQYISGKKKIELIKYKTKRVETDKKIEIIGAEHNNLKKVNVEIPLGKFIVVTGVSGSGKSSLIMDTLYPALLKELRHSKVRPGKYKEIKGLEYIDNVIAIDQSPIGRTPRSNPATYTGVFDLIRDLFAATKEARMKGYTKSRFSFNVKGGRCEACKGNGYLKIEMQFLPDVYVTCDVCKGKRYNKETLTVKYKDKTIADVLDMSVEEALEFFENIPRIKRILQLLNDVGVGYIKLGQPATTLSGGEAQRIKLTSELRKRDTGRTIYFLDEPTTGLHFEDVRKLIEVLHKLVEKGNTVIIIEHNLDVIKNADYIIDLGPEGGEKGGYIVATGTPEDIIKANTYTGKYLKNVL
ncbi:excinuclease ABC subunit A [Marinitoga sp. 1135]|uniref:UvrABC system protein A n=1 Tax=Marinitoga piezophila (strain DSM 14283 / JCM 11233 / KA3) TaxID=443254 RepID=H2J385_MARPK|nr:MULTISPECIES: excinuclease ABC subunit UvrA [Marinitoga]AEX84603.1 excinuclease ABC, A subunit [Marinitoga piezophila KA3]APT75122.1 excinuclease ABC subunit A [Marinitoga sp. 1137]NUU94893.1 excinuclease ABC subunit A [Marinitoga sp. 1135]NUU96831.1 excinuclease ABC subunit A [Marinitoga sp. 1138]